MQLQRNVKRPVYTYAIGKWLVLSGLAMALMSAFVASSAPDYSVQATGRRPLVIANGVTEQLPTADYISTVGGLTTNGTAASGAGDLQTTTATIAGTATFAGPQINTAIITPPTISTTTNNYNPTGLSGASIIVQGATAASAITGLAAQPTGTVITIVNPTTSLAAITLSNLNGSSSAANQFRLPQNTTWTIDVGMSTTLRYSGSDWQIVGAVYQTIPNFTVNSIINLNQIRFPNTQVFSTTGTSNNIALNSNTVVFKYTGTGAATITGLSGSVIGRLLIVYNNSANPLTLANLNGGSISTAQFQNVGNADVTLPADGSSATYVYDTTTNGPWHMVGLTTTTRADALTFTNTKNAGTITLSGGTGTATVTSGAHCVCTDTTATNVVKCAVSTTTLTATGTTTDVISYLCF